MRVWLEDWSFSNSARGLAISPVNAPGTARRIVEDLIEVFSVSEKTVLMSWRIFMASLYFWAPSHVGRTPERDLSSNGSCSRCSSFVISRLTTAASVLAAAEAARMLPFSTVSIKSCHWRSVALCSELLETMIEDEFRVWTPFFSNEVTQGFHSWGWFSADGKKQANRRRLRLPVGQNVYE